ncbi:unnamed protein product [Blepharisma stoltei]|uniref:Uncharacterized protein n=1 Tax=Blepharisma stoltei TaxID=1481888 RepID=A0AAU9IIA5_9CILI|nr:unnamed protein product [Blepharisma stoltei]
MKSNRAKAQTSLSAVISPKNPKKAATSKSHNPSPPKKPINKEEEFWLWMRPETADLENEISSKKRILELLDPRINDIDAELRDQILVRDRQINEMNKTILALRASLKIIKDSKKNELEITEQHKKLQKELSDLKQVQVDQEEHCNQEMAEHEKKENAWKEEKEYLISKQNEILEENEGLKTKLNMKEKELNEVKDDIKQLSVVVRQMSELNRELTGKVDKMIPDMENLQKLYAEAKIKADSVSVLEDEVKQYEEEARRKKEENENIFNNIEDYKKKIKEIEENIKEKAQEIGGNSPEIGGFLQSLRAGVAEIKHGLNKIRKNLKNDMIDEHSVKNVMATLEQELKAAKIQVKKAEAQENAYRTQIESLKDMMNKHQEMYAENIKLYSVKSDSIKKLTEQIKDKMEHMRNEAMKKEVESTKAIAKANTLTERIDVLQKRLKDSSAKEEELIEKIASLKSKLQYLLNDRKSSEGQLTIRENRLKEAIAHLSTLREELFKRDTEIAKKNKVVLKLEKDIENLKAEIETTKDKMKNVEADTKKYSTKIIQDKDKAIEMLKTMIRAKSERFMEKIS